MGRLSPTIRLVCLPKRKRKSATHNCIYMYVFKFEFQITKKTIKYDSNLNYLLIRNPINKLMDYQRPLLILSIFGKIMSVV